mgnify:FL=1
MAVVAVVAVAAAAAAAVAAAAVAAAAVAAGAAAASPRPPVPPATSPVHTIGREQAMGGTPGMPSALRSSQPEIWPENSVMHAGMPSAQPSWSENRVMQSTPRPAAAAAASPSADAA